MAKGNLMIRYCHIRQHDEWLLGFENVRWRDPHHEGCTMTRGAGLPDFTNMTQA